VCTAQSRGCVCVLHSLESPYVYCTVKRLRVCTAQSRECVCVLHSLESACVLHSLESACVYCTV